MSEINKIKPKFQKNQSVYADIGLGVIVKGWIKFFQYSDYEKEILYVVHHADGIASLTANKLQARTEGLYK